MQTQHKLTHKQKHNTHPFEKKKIKKKKNQEKMIAAL